MLRVLLLTLSLEKLKPKTMKKLFVITAFLLATGLKAQMYPTINIWDLQNDTVHLGDSMYIGFKFLPPSQNPIHDTCNFQLWNANATSTPFLWRGDYHDFYSLPKYTQYPWAITDSVYKMYVQIPTVFPTGHCRIYSTLGTPQYVDIYIMPQITTGIEAYNDHRQTKPKVYYNLLGQEVKELGAGKMIKGNIILN